MDEERRARKNEYNRERYRKLRELNIELAREKDREKAKRRRAEYKAQMNEYDRARYAANQEAIRARRAEQYANNVGGIRDKTIAYQKRRYGEGCVMYRLRVALNAARARARKRGIEFDLRLADLGKPTHCAVTGLEFDLSTVTIREGNIFVPSLDRIDPNKGYVKGNVRVVVNGYNMAKHCGSDASVLKLARALVRMFPE